MTGRGPPVDVPERISGLVVAGADHPARVRHDERAGPGRSEGQPGDQAERLEGESLRVDEQFGPQRQRREALAVAERVAGLEADRAEGVSTAAVTDDGHLPVDALEGHDGEQLAELGEATGLGVRGDRAAADRELA